MLSNCILLCILVVIFYILFLKKSNFNVFDKIYKDHVWLNGTSGSGSLIENNREYLKFLNEFINKNNITSIVDVGCGDWQTFKHFNFDGIDYKGFDVAKQVIDTNNNAYSKSNINFFLIPLNETYEYPVADLFICKDVMQHLSYNKIYKILNQLHKYKHFIIINDMDDNTKNKDIKDGGARKIDIRKSPFNVRNLHKIKLHPPHKSQITLISGNSIISQV